jgi:hypothetical protein
VNRAISICSDNGAALLAFQSYAVFSRGVLQCEDFLQELDLSNRVGLVWVPGHCGMRSSTHLQERDQNVAEKAQLRLDEVLTEVA